MRQRAPSTIIRTRRLTSAPAARVSYKSSRATLRFREERGSGKRAAASRDRAARLPAFPLQRRAPNVIEDVVLGHPVEDRAQASGPGHPRPDLTRPAWSRRTEEHGGGE